MAALDGSRINTSDRSKVTDVRYSGAQPSKVGSWSNEADIAFPIEIGWFHKAKHPASEAPQNWYPTPEPSIFGVAPERGNPHIDSFLVPPIDHGNPQKWNGHFRKDNSRADQASKVWIRLYDCPSDYWHINVIKDICKELGTFVSADDILEDKLWGSFLRICISMDQITKIPDEVRIIGARKIWIQKIDREDQLHIYPKCFSLDHTVISCDVSATIQQSYSYMQSPIEVNLQPEPPIPFDTEQAIYKNTLDNENVLLTEANPFIIIAPFSGQCESQQDLLTLLEKTKTLQTGIESKLADSLPPSPYVPRNQLVIEDGNIHSQDMETGTMREMGGQIFTSIGIELEDGEIETSTSEGEEDFEPDSNLILEGTSKGFGNQMEPPVASVSFGTP
ncbi:hypothetical protein SUGI_0305780 [Cryptomeria japonica]|nr:hypothetical protein SUGI_0305780 [Cryptomeria japonica]